MNRNIKDRTKIIKLPNYPLPVLLELCSFPELEATYEKDGFDLEIWNSHSEKAYRLLGQGHGYIIQDVFEYNELEVSTANCLTTLKESLCKKQS